MAGWFYNPPPPQPAAVHFPPNATAAANVPPNPIGPGSLLIRSTWPPESWSSQVLIGGGVGGWTATVFVPPVAIAATNPSILAAIRQTWAPEQWSAQRAAQIASLFAGVVTGPIAYPFPPAALASLRRSWPQESWYAQSESGIAAGLAQTQLPPIYSPNWYGDTLLLLVSTWPREDWRPQTGPKSAGWYPPPAIYTPRAAPHWEWQQWPPEQWNSQTSARIASLVAVAPAPPPYLNVPLRTLLRAAWLPENWPAQTFPDIAGGQSPLSPPLPRPPSQFSISLWSGEFWGPQAGTRDAAILANAQIITLMPWVVGLQQSVAVSELIGLFQAIITIQYVYSGAPIGTVVFQSIAAGTPVSTGTAVTLEVSLGSQIGPIPKPIIESTLPCSITVVESLIPSNIKVTLQ
jgi:hypothetical protein